ncbi:MAG: GNAT family N-acetyltransferase [Thermonemataceae bacterium]
MEITVAHTDNGSKGAFYIEQSEKRLAQMTYSVATSHLIIIDHTEVDGSLRGTGAGKKLVEAAVAYARANQIKILPLCPFAKAIFSKEKQLQDVLR